MSSGGRTRPVGQRQNLAGDLIDRALIVIDAKSRQIEMRGLFGNLSSYREQEPATAARFALRDALSNCFCGRLSVNRS